MSDFDQEEDVPCPCGDASHNNLKAWYEDYLASYTRADGPVLEDGLDTAAVKKKVQEMSSQVPVFNGHCPNCQKLLDAWPEIIKKVPEYDPEQMTPPYQQPHFKTIIELMAGWRNGCLLCTLFIQCSFDRGTSLETWLKKENRLNCLGKSTLILVSVECDEVYFSLTLTWPGLDNYCNLPADPLYCVKNYDEQRFFSGKEAARLTVRGEDLSQLELAKKWLDACLETHESCKTPQDYQLPTRLLDLSCTPIRLVQSSTLTTKPRYATLSHCWGPRQFYTLLQNNLEEFMSAIPEEKLTKTFQDAIHITRSLGLRHLWIDSLCIIQRCKADWGIESALMSAVYGNSTITIAASGATDGTKGCFLKPPGFIGKLHIETSTGEAWDIAPSKFYSSVVQSALSSRAWALQERILSPRILHFSKTGLFWECRHCDASESFPEGSPGFENQHIFHRSRKPIAEDWQTILTLYTGAKLTVASDKLVAMSGIAQKAFDETGDQYLAGLWRKDIELQLLWVQQSPGRRLPSGSAYRAPSWSWASLDENGFTSSVLRRSKDLEYIYHAHVISASIVPAEAPFGQVEGGELRMSYSVMLAGQLKQTQYEGAYGRVRLSHQVVIDSPGHDKEMFRVIADSDEIDGRDIYLLPLIESSGELKGLILLPTGSKKGEYSRAGYFDVSATEDRFTRLLETLGKETAEAQCAEVLEEPEFEEERYVITII